jgi:hypothetical protein
MKTPDEEHQAHGERVMKGFKELIAIGYLVPMRDALGQLVTRRGEQVYQRTSDPELLKRFSKCTHNE